MQKLCLSQHIGQPDNLEVIRLIAAIGVVFGHSFALAMKGNSGVAEPISVLLPGTYSGALAVEAFFFISGFLITHSLLKKPTLLAFLSARAARVLPGFLVMVFVSIFVLVPSVSTLSYRNYIGHPETYHYLWSTLSMDLVPDKNIVWSLPGAFTEHKNTAVNGAIWSLFYEVKLYLLSAIGVLLAAYRFPWIGLVLSFAGLCYALDSGALRSPSDYIMSAIFMYWLGSNCRFHADKLSVIAYPMLVLAVLVYYLRHGAAGLLLYSLLVASVIIYFAYSERVPKLKLWGDYSYGLFLWSFPIQQLLAHHWPSLGPYRFFVVSLMLSFIFAALSWHYIEKPVVQWNKRRLMKSSLSAAR
jgi:peptidoglycan/LPS O-acetylase OafA/YrhL